MFEAVQGNRGVGQGSRRTAVLVTLGAHLVVFGIVIIATASSETGRRAVKELVLTLTDSPPPPPPPAGSASAPKRPTKPTRKRNPSARAIARRPESSPAEAGGGVGGVKGGVLGGVVGGQVGGTGVVPFGAGMVRPSLVKRVDVVYTREAREARVGGTAILRCDVMSSGALRRCRLIKGLPFLDQAILEAVSRWIYTPATFQGQPVSVEYVITLKLSPP